MGQLQPAIGALGQAVIEFLGADLQVLDCGATAQLAALETALVSKAPVPLALQDEMQGRHRQGLKVLHLFFQVKTLCKA